MSQSKRIISIVITFILITVVAISSYYSDNDNTGLVYSIVNVGGDQTDNNANIFEDLMQKATTEMTYEGDTESDTTTDKATTGNNNENNTDSSYDNPTSNAQSSSDSTTDEATTDKTTTQTTSYTGWDADILDEAESDYDYYYKDDEVRIAITVVEDKTAKQRYYVADIRLSSAQYLQTAFAYNDYNSSSNMGVKEMAESNNAILAINGDYCKSRSGGVYIRNGILYDESYCTREQLMMDIYGNFNMYPGETASASKLIGLNAWQVWSFGPAFIMDGKIRTDYSDRYDTVKGRNPRTMIGQLGELHYVFVVVDGRDDYARGMTYEQCSDLMLSLGCTFAYNLDGGGSSTMVFQNEILNNPSQGSEREVSDCVMIMGGDN